MTSPLGTGKCITFFYSVVPTCMEQKIRPHFYAFVEKGSRPQTCSLPPSADIAIIAASLSFLLVFLLSASKEGGVFFLAYFIHRGHRTGARAFSTDIDLV
jgi:hypothetical protein